MAGSLVQDGMMGQMVEGGKHARDHEKDPLAGLS
jgi:hypothetical protein